MNLARNKGRCLTLFLKAPVLLVFLLAASLSVSVSPQPVQTSLTLVYTRANGRIGDVSLTSSGELLFTNYPTKSGRLWCLTGGFETLAYEVSKATYDLYGVAASRDGDVYVSCPYTGEIIRIVPSGGVSTVYVSPVRMLAHWPSPLMVRYTLPSLFPPRDINLFTGLTPPGL